MGAAALGLAACGDPREEDSESGSVSLSASSPQTMTADDSATGSGTADDDDGPTSETEGTKLDVGGAEGADSSTGIDECAGISDMSDVGLQPADIIVVVDNSGSMDFEAGVVQSYLNMFSSQIFLANIDAHVVLISSYPGMGNGICIDPPLGNGGCPADDDNPPLYTHVNQEVDSNNSLELLLSTHAMWAPAMRATASKHIIVVTDDNSDLSAADFSGMWAALDPTYVPFKVHSIAPSESPFTACPNNLAPCCLTAADGGFVYQQLVASTMGVFGDLCLQQFQPIFDEVAEQVIQGSALACEFTIPPPPDGEEFDPAQVNVEFEDDAGMSLDIGYVETAAECDGVANGWHYDDPAMPATIILCPQTCDAVQGFTMATVSIVFGCATMPAG